MQKNSRIRASVYALLAAVFYAISTPFSKFMMTYIKPTFMAFVVNGEKLTYFYFAGLILMLLGSGVVVYDSMRISNSHEHFHMTEHTNNVV